jgi:hypothetical protein
MTDWNLVINNLSGGSDVTVDPTRWNLDNPGYVEIYDIWKNANFNFNSIKWTNYYPGVHFSNDIVNEQLKNLNLKKAHKSWISKIDPGYMAPWHWDVDDFEDEYLKDGPITRHTVIIENMSHGHILIVGDDHYFNRPKDTIIKWNNYKEWHSGINAGMTPSYMFHILGC